MELNIHYRDIIPRGYLGKKGYWDAPSGYPGRIAKTPK